MPGLGYMRRVFEARHSKFTLTSSYELFRRATKARTPGYAVSSGGPAPQGQQLYRGTNLLNQLVLKTIVLIENARKRKTTK